MPLCLTGHAAIKELERYFEVWVLTQNIDGFHTKACSTNVIEIHGNIDEVRAVASICAGARACTYAYVCTHAGTQTDRPWCLSLGRDTHGPTIK
jgi:NAD-dependent SIR2 family protein deacetylase